MKCPHNDLSCPYVNTSGMTKEKSCEDCEFSLPMAPLPESKEPVFEQEKGVVG